MARPMSPTWKEKGGLQGCSGPKIRDHGGLHDGKGVNWGLRSFSYTVVVEEAQWVFIKTRMGETNSHSPSFVSS